MAIPAYMSKKIGKPVMMRISRAEEYFIGNARTGFQGRIKIGFDKAGRVTAADLYVVQENGPTTGFPDWPSAGDTVSILYQPPAMRFRGTCVMTNTIPRVAQRGPGHNQTVAAVEPHHRQGRAAAWHRSARDPPHQRPENGREVRRSARAGHELLSAGGDG